MFASSVLGSSRDSGCEPAPVVVYNIFACLTCNPNEHSQGMMSVLPNQRLSQVFSTLGHCFVSSQPIPYCPTYKNKKWFFSVYKWAFPIWNFFPTVFQLNFLKIGFLITVLPKDDRTDLAQEEKTGSSILDHDLGHLCFGRRIQVSGHSDFGIFNNDGASSILTWVSADTASAGSLDKRPWLLRPSFVMQMNLVLWILRKSLNHLSQCHLGARVFFCIFGTVAPTPNSWDDRCPVMTHGARSCPLSLLQRSFRQLPCRYFLEFSHPFSTASFASDMFIAWGIGVNLCTKL